MIFCVCVVYLGENDVCDVTLSAIVARHGFQACPVWICTQSNITNIKYNFIEMYESTNITL